MNRRAFAQHLEKELPVLVAEGIIDPETARRLRERYEGGGSRAGLMSAALGSLGALFVGGGVILVVAHNWSELPRAVRAALSSLPLALSIALAAFVLATERLSAAWREGVGIFYVLSAAASIALVSQTYNIQGSGESFLFAWALFALPVVYLLDSAGAAVVWLGALSGWFAVRLEMGGAWGWFAFAAAFLPWMAWRLYRTIDLSSTALAVWAAILSLSVAQGPVFAGTGRYWSFTGLAALLAGMAMAGEVLSERVPSPWKNPALVLGRLGSLVLLLVLTYPDVWRWALSEREQRTDWSGIGWAFFVLFSIGWGVAAALAWVRRQRQALVLGALPLAVVAVGLAGRSLGTGGAALIMDAACLAVGVDYLRWSAATKSLADLNLGMGLIAVLAVLRFFDSDLGILARGLAFIAIGAGFLAVNRALAKRWRKEGGA